MTFTAVNANKGGNGALVLLRDVIALGLCAVAVACSAQPETSKTARSSTTAGSSTTASSSTTTGSGATTGSSQSVTQITEALGAANYCPDTIKCTTSDAAVQATVSWTTPVITSAKDLLNTVGAIYSKSPGGIASGIFSFVQDTWLTSPSPSTTQIDGDIDCVNQELQCVAQGLSWQISETAWYTDEYTPVMTALSDMTAGYGVGSPDDVGSHNGTFAAGQADMFSRAYIPSATDGDGNWKKTFYNSAPESMGPGEVFDWQGGFTRFMTLITKRLAIMGYLDPNFQADGSRLAEIDGATTGYRALLQGWLREMTNGVACDVQDRNSAGQSLEYQSAGEYSYTDIACADVNTGISEETTMTVDGFHMCDECAGGPYYPDQGPCLTDVYCLQSLSSYWSVWTEMNLLANVVRSQLPIFGVNSMIDTLYKIAHPAPDLTGTLGRIPVSANHTLCLDVVGGNSASGTPVQIWGCNETGAQQWSYDRQAQTITNTAFGKCLQVRQRPVTLFGYTFEIDDLTASAVPEISDCVSPAPVRQQWTYDPQTGIIRSALGAVLEIQYGNLQAGTPVVMNAQYDNGYSTSTAQQWYADRAVKGDGYGLGYTDIWLTGAAWGNIPLAWDFGNGFFISGSSTVDDTDFTDVWATSPNVKALAGDFNGDGLSDIALTGGGGWQSIPVALNQSKSAYHVVNAWTSDTASFGYWASSPGVAAVSGDFNGDGRTDVALTGGSGWWTIPIAFSNGDGSFRVTDQSVDTTFNSYATQPGARPVVGDFNGDGFSDIAIVGGITSNLIPVALSNGDGNFTIQLETVTAGDPNFAYYATLPGVQAVPGDFDGDGKGDIALTGGSGWWTIPVAFSTNGSFSVANNDIPSGDGNFPYYSPEPGVMAVSGDFNKDGKSDIALTGGPGWLSIPVAFSNGDGTFSPVNNATLGPDFPTQAATSGVSAVGGAY